MMETGQVPTSHHTVPNSVLDCREIRGRHESRLWSPDTSYGRTLKAEGEDRGGQS